jgi:hypothetical protein
MGDSGLGAAGGASETGTAQETQEPSKPSGHVPRRHCGMTDCGFMGSRHEAVRFHHHRYRGACNTRSSLALSASRRQQSCVRFRDDKGFELG